MNREDKERQIREAAEADLLTFIRLVAPHRVLGKCHEEVISWWQREDALPHQLLLLPRDHQKSALVAYRVAHLLTKNPEKRVLYISSTANLAEQQLYFIKAIFESDIHRRYWPDHIHPDEGKRDKWAAGEIKLDHPLRKELGVRDPSIFTAGLTTSITGMHCDVAVLDDVVVAENSKDLTSRAKVEAQYSLLASIESTGSEEWIVGTRYDPRDLYNTLQEQTVEVYDEHGNHISDDPLFEVWQREVEDRGDGTGSFLWPKQRSKNGRWYGFDINELAKKRAKYVDRKQFRAQYYNDPSDPDDKPIDYDKFQYWNKEHLKFDRGSWYYQGNRLNLTAAIDFAYSTREQSDYTAIVVIGVDGQNNIYVLDILRFQTTRISDYFKNLFAMYSKWDFRKLRAETSGAQEAIVRSLKEDYIQPKGITLSVESVKPNSRSGSKEERIEAVLTPKYDNLQVWHGKGGLWQILEDELITNSPAHDDVKDALTIAIEGAIKPGFSKGKSLTDRPSFNKRFGGRR